MNTLMYRGSDRAFRRGGRWFAGAGAKMLSEMYLSKGRQILTLVILLGGTSAHGTQIRRRGSMDAQMHRISQHTTIFRVLRYAHPPRIGGFSNDRWISDTVAGYDTYWTPTAALEET